MAKGPRKSVRRNPAIARGVNKRGHVAADQANGRWKFSKLGAKGKKVAPKAKPTPSTNDPRFYAADDVRTPLKHRKTHKKATKLRKSITPGTIVIILAGRFRGKRVIVLKQLKSGLLLVTGPYKVNGVPLRRVNQAYVIATSTKVDVSKIDVANVNDEFFAKKEEKKAAKKDGDFLAEKDEKKVVPQARKDAQKKVDAGLAAVLKATPHLAQYLNAKFTLTKNTPPHEIKF
jgi:large subunit ribosomal protein L6e